MPPLHLTTVTSESLPGDADEFDLLICACGYESRATNAARLMLSKFKAKLAVGFQDRRALNYDANKRWFAENEFNIIEPDDNSFRTAFSAVVAEAFSDRLHLRVVVDISCFNRFRLAQLVDHFRSLGNQSVSIHFVYSLAQYSTPAESIAPTTIVEPVSQKWPR